MKAPWDAYKVALGAEQEKDTMVNPTMEMMWCKCIELFAESIPAVLIQSSAILNTIKTGGHVTTTVYLSLVISLLTTGFVSATFSYDFDTDPKKRAFNPDFYGFVPDSQRKRGMIFVTMILLSSIQVLVKSTFIVLLGSMALQHV